LQHKLGAKYLILVTVPAFNESKNLKNCIEKLLKKTSKLNEKFQIIIAEDGSTDGTDQIAKEIEKKYPQVIHLHSTQKLGKGLALTRAFNKKEADIYAFIDCDLATNLEYFPKLINSIKTGNDLALGSRYKKGATINRVALRDTTSRLYNKLIRIIFRDQVFDHQIGFKAFSNQLIKSILNKCESKGWFWDTEIIVRSKKNNFKIHEFPVEWNEKSNGSSHIKMIINVGIQNVIGITKLIFNIKSNN
jgi:glycosyltransferase involved in cell wall biosynthesis